MNLQLSDDDLRRIAAEVAKLLGQSGTSSSGRGKAKPAASGNRPGRKPGLTVEEASEAFPTLSVRTLKRAVTEGRLEAAKNGRINRAELQRFLDSRA